MRCPRIPLHSQQQPPSKFKNDTAQHSTQHTAADQAHSSRPATQQQTPTQHELQHRQRARWSRGTGRSHVAGDDHTAVVEALQGCCQMQPVRQVVCLLHRADGGSLRQDQGLPRRQVRQSYTQNPQGWGNTATHGTPGDVHVPSPRGSGDHRW